MIFEAAMQQQRLAYEAQTAAIAAEKLKRAAHKTHQFGAMHGQIFETSSEVISSTMNKGAFGSSLRFANKRTKKRSRKAA